MPSGVPTLLLLVAVTTALAGIALGSGGPARGYDTWDGFGTNFNESDVFETAQVLRSLSGGAYEYLVLDEGWSHDGDNFQWVLNQYGMPIPNPMTFPSAIDGTFTVLAGELQRNYNIKLGIWLIRGVPYQAVQENLTVFGTDYVMADIINASRRCDWHPDAYALNMSHPGAQKYLDYMFKTYVEWGLRYFKVDCIFARNLDVPEIFGTAIALAATQSDVVFSLSPGYLATAAQAITVTNGINAYGVPNSYRITDDMWACWNTRQELALLGEGWGHCILNSTRKVREFIPVMNNGYLSFPDGDMLPVGTFGTKWGPFPYGKLSPLTTSMLRFAFGLWSIARMPVILSGNLATMGQREGALAIANNSYLTAVHQRGRNVRELLFVDTNPSDLNSIGYAVWASQNPDVADGYFLGLFAFSENYTLPSTSTVRISINVTAVGGADGPVKVFYMVSVWNDAVVDSITDQSKTGLITLDVPANDAQVLVLLPQQD